MAHFDPSASSSGSPLRAATMFVCLAALLIYYLLFDFSGLSSAEGMDQAQLARPQAMADSMAAKGDLPIGVIEDNQYAPLYPVMLSLVMRGFQSHWSYTGESKESVYYMDRVVAAFSMALFFCALAVNYLFLSRLFDRQIAGWTVILLLFCESLWQFTQSGLPQMLMLLLFSLAMYALYNASEQDREGKPGAAMSLLGAGIALGLLALAHLLTLWLAAGCIAFCALTFQRKWRAGLILLLVTGLFVAPWLYWNVQRFGNVMGAGKAMLYAGLGGGSSEASLLRSLDGGGASLRVADFIKKVSLLSLAQISEMMTYLGGIIAAPLFFVALIHQFKREGIRNFRWAVLLVWVAAVFGMACFGLPEKQADSNQLHLLFIPLMTGYGLALLTVLWSRLRLNPMLPMANNGAFLIVLLLSALPFALNLPSKFLQNATKATARAQWPPYYPLLLAKVGESTKPEEVMVSDMPWATAWYMDRKSLYLPLNAAQFQAIEKTQNGLKVNFTGFLFTPLTTNLQFGDEVLSKDYIPWSPMIMNWGLRTTLGVDTMANSKFPYKEAHSIYQNWIVLFVKPGTLKS